jgi:hypothetical protein
MIAPHLAASLAAAERTRSSAPELRVVARR